MDASESVHKSLPGVVTKYSLSERLPDTIQKEKNSSKVFVVPARSIPRTV